ncbi:unnamed protein product [Lymnaea stagnalis]|uniref:Uncharacterized protein n=1 Tax=Lymnaea stagnalis TaxID=6523 RepID=A0AAV2HQ48_LYMST
MKSEIFFSLVMTMATLTLTFCETIPLTFEVANIVMELEQVIADQFLTCLCKEPSTDCTLYGERLEDFKTYRILSVHLTGSVDQGPAHVRNCMTIFIKSDMVITCSKVTESIYTTNPQMRERCQALKPTTTGGRCTHYSGIVWNLMPFRITMNDSVFETLRCERAFRDLLQSELFSSADALNQAIVITSITLGILLFLMFVVIQYMKPKRQYPLGSDV